jgi:hypothetical protein
MQAVQARARALKAEGKSADEVATTVRRRFRRNIQLAAGKRACRGRDPPTRGVPR